MLLSVTVPSLAWANSTLLSPLQLPSNSGLTISNANSAWVEQSYTLQKEFQDALTKYYQAEVKPLTSAQVRGSLPWGDATARPGGLEF